MRHKNSNYTFSRVPSVVKQRSVFDRSRTYKTTLNVGLLYPFYLDEILPGDTIAKLNVNAFARLTTPLVPFMDNLYMDFHFFFVPSRLVWSNWQRFCGEQDNPDDSTDYLIPVIKPTTSIAVGSLADYFGIPVGKKNFEFNALPFRAYNLIWNQFYRDENLQDSEVVNLDDGPDDYDDYILLPRGKAKCDPFTSALPWPQKGPGVELPIGGAAPVKPNGNAIQFIAEDENLPYGLFTTNKGNLGTSGFPPDIANAIPNAAAGQSATRSLIGPASGSATAYQLGFGPETGLYADLSSATAVTINSLREAFQIQRWYEQLARGGSRYQELLLTMFGTDAGDARLQRPEYLGGGTIPINVHSVAQTSATVPGDEATPQGNLAAYGVAGGSGIGFSKSFVEHGYVIGLVSIRGDITYQQGLDRLWSRQTKFDFYWPAFAHLGEVGIPNKEIFLQGDGNVNDDKIFGYQERWYEYRYGISHITGKLRSGIVGSLDYWHLGEYFASLPTLSDQFVKVSVPVDRVLAVQNEPQFVFDSVIQCRHARVMPTYSVPGLVDHF